MPTRRQLSKSKESQFEFPATRRDDDPCYSKPIDPEHLSIDTPAEEHPLDYHGLNYSGGKLPDMERKEDQEEKHLEEVRRMISDELLNEVFGHSNFGSQSKRDVLRYTLLKCACGYYSGHTAKCIAIELGLIYEKKWTLTKLGQQYLYEAFRNGTNF